MYEYIDTCTCIFILYFRPFGLEWWYFMTLTGIFIACTFW